MNHGTGWVLFEEYFHSPNSKKLISILPPRKAKQDVASFVEQTYVDHHASIKEKLAYKKHRKSWPYPVSIDPINGAMHCGHEPFFVCVYALKITIHQNILDFQYRIVSDRTNPMTPIFELRQQSIDVES